MPVRHPDSRRTPGQSGPRPDSRFGSDDDSGFTLVEIMVVMLVLAILLAIAIPTFIGVSNNAADRSAQASLNSGLTDAKAVYAADQSFPADTAYQLGRNDPALQFVSATTPTTSPGTISVATVPQAILMTNRSDAGTCWWALVVATAPAGVGAGLPSVPGIYYNQSTGASCQASDFPTAGWQSNSYPTP